MRTERDLTFWLRWVLANALGEAVGLSTVLLVGFGVLGRAVEGLPGAWPFVARLAAGAVAEKLAGLAY